LDTGSPHFISFVDNVKEMDVDKEGKAIRYNDRFKSEGTNVNFVQLDKEGISVRTYERGVEAETLACGTGAVACAIATYEAGHIQKNSIPVKVLGGELKVEFEKKEAYTEVYLSGPYQEVFKGSIEC